MNRFTKGQGIFGSVTLDGGATLKGNKNGYIEVTGYSRVATGSSGWYYSVTQSNDNALTGTLRAGYFVATNGTSAATGTIRGLEVKSRAANSSNVGANVAYLEGISLSADAKTKNVTRLYGMEMMLDGAAGGTVTLAVGLQISNNASDTQTNSYAIRINSTGGAHKAFTKDIILQNGESIDNATDGTVQITAGVLKLAYDAAAYMTITQADAGGVTFDSVSDGTAGFAFSDAVAITSSTAAQLVLKYGASDYVSMTQADAGTFTLDITTDGTAEFIFNDKVSVLSPLKVSYDAAAYMTITVADAGGVTFADVSDGTAGFTFSQSTDFTLGLKVATTGVTIAPDATAGISLYSQTGTLNANPGAAVIANTVNINHSAGAGDCDDLIASYAKVNVTGDGDSGLTAVGFAARAYQGAATANTTAAQEVYGAQVWAKHMGTGTCTAMSALSAKLQINKTDAFTATNSINAGHFHVEAIDGVANGALTSAHFDGVMIEIYPEVTSLDSVLKMAVETTKAVGAWFDLDGGSAVVSLFDFNTDGGVVLTNALVPAAAPDGGTMGADRALKVMVGATPYYIPMYDTLHA